jgi:carbon monoxide dehydrogenase subunit G
MSEVSTFESRSGKVTCSAEEFYSFVTDLRNFKRFIPAGTTTVQMLEKESCNFKMSMLGTVRVRIEEKIKPGKVVLKGNAMQINDFQINVNIIEPPDRKAEIKIILSAELNPLLKMMAAEPVKSLLEKLIKEMEKFNGWSDLSKDTQPL